MTGNGIFDWLSILRSALAGTPAISTKLDLIPGVVPTARAVYLSHLSTILNPRYPCISLHLDAHADPRMQIPLRGLLYLDVWTPDRPPATGAALAVGKQGAWSIYTPVRRMLHMAHRRTSALEVFSTSEWSLKYAFEQRVTDDLWEPEYHLYHLAAQYEVILRECGASAAYGV